MEDAASLQLKVVLDQLYTTTLDRSGSETCSGYRASDPEPNKKSPFGQPFRGALGFYESGAAGYLSYPRSWLWKLARMSGKDKRQHRSRTY